MENSFFEYRDRTGVESDSGSEVIDNSIDEDNSFNMKKTPAKKNKTVFVAESEESSADDDLEDDIPNVPKIIIQRNGLPVSHIVSSSEDDTNTRGSITRQSQLEMSFNNVVLSSSDDESPDVSPEIVPKRRPPQRPATNTSIGADTSLIGRKKNKRMILVDSDTENSIIIEHNKNKKMTCLKDTPLKVDDNKMTLRKQALNSSVMDQSVSYTDESDDNDLSNNIKHHHSLPKTPSRIKNRKALIESDDSSESDEDDEEENESDENKLKSDQKKQPSDKSRQKSDDDHHKSDEEYESAEDDDGEVTEDDGPDEDQLVYSRATRMSIMGVMPKGVNETDDSDFIESDETSRPSSTTDLPDVTIAKQTDVTPQKPTLDSDSSKISCSPFGSPLHDITNEINQIEDSYASKKQNLKENELKSRVKTNLLTSKQLEGNKENDNDDDVTFVSTSFEEVPKRRTDVDEDVTFVSTNRKDVTPRVVKSERVIDDDVTIVDAKPEIIAISDDEDEDDSNESKPNSIGFRSRMPRRSKSPGVERKSSTRKTSPRSKSPRKRKSRSPRPSESPTLVKPGKPPSTKRSPKVGQASSSKDGTMRQYLVPPSYPNQQVVYVKKHVRENELSKLESLKADLQNIKYLLENMDMESLPDGGVKLIERLTGLEHMVREQGEKVANMVVEPDMPSAEDMAADGFDAQSGLSWEELQKGSQAVQPRMFGKQAMATHMAERNLILDRLRDLHESLASRPPETQLAPPPPAVKSEMMQHQLHALAWLRWRETQRPRGGILADDMGLGKTITMISLIVSDKDGKMDEDDDNDEGGRGISKLARGGTLVVCPASLIQQWSGEVTKHCTSHAASVCLHHGAARATHPHRLATYDMVLTTYNILQRDNEKNGVLMKVLWRRIILDEAHIVRNHKAATSMAVSALRGSRRWCLTGTPVQNKDLDLFALLKFLRCTPFDELTMWKKWIDNKSQGGQDRLSTIMQCILLRRTKVQLQEKGQLKCLPERTTHLQEVTLAKEEMNVYQKVLVFSKTLFGQFLHQRAEKQAGMQGLDAPDNSAYDKMHKKMIALQGAKPVKSHEILVLLLRLRQVCCHCGLIAAMLDEETAGDGVDMDPGGQDLLAELNKLSIEDARSKRKSKEPEKEEDEGPAQEGTTAAEAIRSVLSPNNPVFELTRQSSKIKAVMECLHQNVFSNTGHKAVVVSQWTSVLRLVEQELQKARVRSVTLSGNVPVPHRPPIIDKLNDPKSDVKVMLLSLCAGGVGLNLCGANHLLLLDPHWNPQLEEQAQDRIYRVGQSRPVHIYRFMCVDTVEQSIRKLQLAKLELAENVLTGAKNTNNSKLTIEDLKMLFNMGPQPT